MHDIPALHSAVRHHVGYGIEYVKKSGHQTSGKQIRIIDAAVLFHICSGQTGIKQKVMHGIHLTPPLCLWPERLGYRIFSGTSLRWNHPPGRAGGILFRP